MRLELLTKEEIEYTEQLGKDIVAGKVRGVVVNLIDELEKLKRG